MRRRPPRPHRDPEIHPVLSSLHIWHRIRKRHHAFHRRAIHAAASRADALDILRLRDEVARPGPMHFERARQLVRPEHRRDSSDLRGTMRTVADLVLARPDHTHGFAESLRKQRRFDRGLRMIFAPKLPPIVCGRTSTALRSIPSAAPTDRWMWEIFCVA